MADIKTMWLPGASGPQNLADVEAREQLKNKLDATDLPEAINTALAQAKTSGEFDGEKGDPGYTPVRGTDYWTDDDIAAINAESQTYIDEKVAEIEIPEGSSVGSLQIAGTTGNGTSYAATVPGIDALTVGAHFIMIPHANSTKGAPMLNVNALGEKTLRMAKPVNSSMSATPSNIDWLRGNYPVLVIYDGTYWVVHGMSYIDAEAFRGTLPASKGGLGTTSIDDAAAALSAVRYTAQSLTYEQKAQVRDNIGAVGTGDYVATNQGTANVGKILVVGADGNLTLTDMPELLSGDVIGMLDENNNIVITGELADGTYTFRYENTDGTYADIGSLTIGSATVTYSITNKLTYVTNDNSTAIVEEGSPYTATLTPDSGYQINSVVITMGGADVTSSVYANGKISIPSVTGDVIITAAAVAIPTGPAYTNIIDTVGYTNDARVSTSSGELRTGATGYTSTGIIDLTPYAKPRVLRTKGVDFRQAVYTHCNIAFFSDANGTFSAGYGLSSGGGIIGNGNCTVDAEGNMTLSGGNFANYDYARFSGYGDGANLIVTVNEEITD